MPIIEVDNITKTYRAERGVRVLLGRGGISSFLRGKRSGEVTALSDVSFTVEPGESLGIIGANGSGKSTLLKLIAGVTAPTSGGVNVYGRVASLLELGAGFHPMLTGRENVYLNAGILGMRHAQVDAVFDQILDFSGIGDFIDYPVDTYSSGMYVRIGFAVAAYTNPDVFLIDEVLSVGDEEFQRKCRRRIGELREEGKTIVFVSHDLGIVNTLCQRVILLSRGKMITRDTPRKAIDFYLRQVGSEKGIHTMADAETEAIVCDGRVSLFHNHQEVTASSAMHCRVFSLGNWHESHEADWEVIERGPKRCVAHGRYSRVAGIVVWSVALEGDTLEWSIALECEEDSNVERFSAVLLFSPRYEQWVYDEETGVFPGILPEDMEWTHVISPELVCNEAGLIPEEGANLPPVAMSIQGDHPAMSAYWANTDYMTGCRALRVDAHLAEQGEQLSAGRHEIMDVRVQLDRPKEALIEQGQRRTLAIGPLGARFERGRISLTYDGAEITDSLCVYASLLIGNLWNDSQTLRWESFEKDGDRLIFTGASRRFPFRMHWELYPADGALGIEIWLEALEPLDVQEHHTSVVLKYAYNRWERDDEFGEFAEIGPECTDWQHVNANYAPGRFAKATGPGLPTVTLEADPDRLPLRMTFINTDHQKRARVLQALRSPEHGALHFDTGRHLYFAGHIGVDKPV